MRFYSTRKLTMLWAVLGVGSICIFAPLVAMADNLYVIAHPGVELSEAQLKEVYLGERQFVGSIKLVPVDNTAAQNGFLNKVMSMDAAVYASLWIKKAFRAGLAAPEIKSGDAEIVSFIRKTPGSVGYVSAPIAGERVLLQY